MNERPAMNILRYAAVFALFLMAAAMVLIVVLTITHGTPVRTVIAADPGDQPPAVTDSLFARTMELYTGSHIGDGNKVQLMLNGKGSYAPLWRDLESAKRTVAVQIYYSEPGKVADRMRDVLAARARAGVRVLLLLDAFGSSTTAQWPSTTKRT